MSQLQYIHLDLLKRTGTASLGDRLAIICKLRNGACCRSILYPLTLMDLERNCFVIKMRRAQVKVRENT